MDTAENLIWYRALLVYRAAPVVVGDGCSTVLSIRRMILLVFVAFHEP